MGSFKNPFQEIENSLDTGDGPGKKQLIAGSVILFLIIFLAFGFWYWQKNNNRFNLNYSGLEGVDFAKDTDGDGLFDEEEKVWGTDVSNIDTDGDSFSDYDEINNGYNPLGEGELLKEEVKSKKGIIEDKKQIAESQFLEHFKKSHFNNRFKTLEDRVGDLDGDGLENIIEQVYGTNPEDSDTDGDGISDGIELKNYTNPVGNGTIDESIVKNVSNEDHYYCFAGNCKEHIEAQDDALMDNCYSAEAILKKSPSICEKTKGGEFDGRGDCYKTIAVLFRDEKYCKQIPESDKEESFNERNKCFTLVAEKEKKINICDNIVVFKGYTNDYPNSYENRYFCYAAVAAFKGDMKICEEIINNYTKELNTVLRPYYKKNTLWDDNLIEESIAKDLVGMESYDRCLLSIATFEKNINICEKIVDKKILNDCYNNIAIAKKDFILCGKIEKENNSYNNKDYCYEKVGIDLNDIKVCDLIKSQSYKDSCLLGIGKNVKNILICQKISDNFKKDSCYEEVAKNTKELSICFNIQEEHRHDTCVEGLLSLNDDVLICKKLKQDNYQNSCIVKLASLKNDISLCDQARSLKDWCIKVFREKANEN